MKLKHRRGEQYSFSTVSVQHDGRDIKFPVENGEVEVENEAQARSLENTGKWERLEDKEAPYALRDKTVDEVEQYLEDINDIDRLKELRKLESDGKDRKNALNAVDSRVEELKNQEEEGESNDEVSEEGENEDGTENEE